MKNHIKIYWAIFFIYSASVFAIQDCLHLILLEQKKYPKVNKINHMLESITGKIDTREKQVIINGKKFQEVSGGPLKLKQNDILAGSEVFGGKQPNFIIDLRHPALASILKYAKEIGQKDLSVLEKIDLIQKEVSSSLKSKNPYINPNYQALMKRYRDKGTPISLGEYLENHVGVCREHAAILHLSLMEAGIENRYLYVRTAVQSERGRDHAIVIFENEGELFIADAYFKEYHKQKFKDVWISAPESEKFFPFDLVLPYPKQWKPLDNKPSPVIYNKDFTWLLNRLFINIPV